MHVQLEEHRPGHRGPLTHGLVASQPWPAQALSLPLSSLLSPLPVTRQKHTLPVPVDNVELAIGSPTEANLRVQNGKLFVGRENSSSRIDKTIQTTEKTVGERERERVKKQI